MGNCINKIDKMESEKSSINLASATYDVPEYSLANICHEGKVVYVYDCDTVHIVFVINGQFVKYNCRLLGIDSPEICPKNVKDLTKREQEIACAIKSRNWLITQVTGLVPSDKITKKEIKELCGKSRQLVWVKCHDFDKYGRLLVELFANKSDTVSLNKLMVEKHLAVEYDGGTKKEFNVPITEN